MGPAGSRVEPVGSTMWPAGSRVEPVRSTADPAGFRVEPVGSTMVGAKAAGPRPPPATNCHSLPRHPQQITNKTVTAHHMSWRRGPTRDYDSNMYAGFGFGGTGAGPRSGFVAQQRDEEQQRRQPAPLANHQIPNKVLAQDQFPGWNRSMVLGNCPSCFCSKPDCRTEHNGGLPKPNSSGIFVCRACNQPRPKSTSWWSIPSNGGPGACEQKKARQSSSWQEGSTSTQTAPKERNASSSGCASSSSGAKIQSNLGDSCLFRCSRQGHMCASLGCPLLCSDAQSVRPHAGA